MAWDDETDVAKLSKFLPEKPTEMTNAVRLFLSGDYWQDGSQWVGIQVPPEAKNYGQLVADQERCFTPQPLISEVADRHVNGVVGREPAFSMAFAEDVEAAVDGDESEPALEARMKERAAFLDETNDALDEWWDSHLAHETVQDFTLRLISEEEACLRVFVPPGLIAAGVGEEEGNPEGGDGNWQAGRLKSETTDWRAALDAIHLESPDPTTACVAIDLKTKRPASLFSFKEVVEEEGREAQKTRLEISFVNDDGQTVIRILDGDGRESKGVILGEAIQELGGEIYIAQARRRALISDAIRRQQNALNVVNTMMLHNSNLAGHRDRTYINVKRPQVKVPDAREEKGFRYEDSPLVIGPGVANFLAGITYKDNDEKERVASGSLIITDPVSPEPLISAKEQYEESIYKGVSQLHVLLARDGNASAVSRIQARADFVESLRKTAPKVEGVLRSRLRLVLLLACWLAGDMQRLARIRDELRVRVDCRLNAGPVTPDELDVISRLREKGMISRETAQVMCGIEDTGSEEQKIADEQMPENLTLPERVKLFVDLAASGSAAGAAQIVGFNEEEVKLLSPMDLVPPKEPGDNVQTSGNNPTGG